MPKPYQPTPREVESLLSRAAAHPLGAGFLVDGALDAVAATFGVHAFVVEEARRQAALTYTSRRGAGARIIHPAR